MGDLDVGDLDVPPGGPCVERRERPAVERVVSTSRFHFACSGQASSRDDSPSNRRIFDPTPPRVVERRQTSTP